MREFPVANRIAKKFTEDNVVVLTINDDRNTEKIRDAYEKVNSSLPVLLDKGSNVVRAYQAYAIPIYYLIDQEQKISNVWVGSVKDLENQLNEKITALLEAQTSSEAEKAATPG